MRTPRPAPSARSAPRHSRSYRRLGLPEPEALKVELRVFRVEGFGFRVEGFGLRVLGSGLRVLGFGFRGWGLGNPES